MPAEGGRSGRARKRRGARVTASHAYQVGAVVCVHARDMKEPWCLAASDAEAAAGTLIKQYARRWTIEPSFRDTKDLRFGMGMAEMRIAEPERRDRLLLISAFAMVLLTMLGAAGESLGMGRLRKSNTSKTRTHCKRCFGTLGLQRLRMGFRAPSSMASTRQCAFAASR
jgi:hypothetical protein